MIGSGVKGSTTKKIKIESEFRYVRFRDKIFDLLEKRIVEKDGVKSEPFPLPDYAACVEYHGVMISLLDIERSEKRESADADTPEYIFHRGRLIQLPGLMEVEEEQLADGTGLTYVRCDRRFVEYRGRMLATNQILFAGEYEEADTIESCSQPSLKESASCCSTAGSRTLTNPSSQSMTADEYEDVEMVEYSDTATPDSFHDSATPVDDDIACSSALGSADGGGEEQCSASECSYEDDENVFPADEDHSIFSESGDEYDEAEESDAYSGSGDSEIECLD